MPSITVRNVPEEARNELAARAARAGHSLQEYLRRELVALAERPNNAELVARIEERKRQTGTRLSVEEILALKDADRAERP